MPVLETCYAKVLVAFPAIFFYFLNFFFCFGTIKGFPQSVVAPCTISSFSAHLKDMAIVLRYYLIFWNEFFFLNSVWFINHLWVLPQNSRNWTTFPNKHGSKYEKIFLSTKTVGNFVWEAQFLFSYLTHVPWEKLFSCMYRAHP